MSRNCQKCGGQVGEADLYCIHCGVPLERIKEEQKQEREESLQQAQKAAPEETAKPLSVKDYLLIGVLMSIPIVNLILAILWASGKNENPNRRNLARAWLIFCAAGVVIVVIFFIGLVRAAWLDEQNRPGRYDHYEHYDYYDYYDYYDDYDDWEYWDEWEDWEEYDYDYDMEYKHHWREILDDWGEI